MSFLDCLEAALKARPGWTCTRSADGHVLRVADDGRDGSEGAPEVHVCEENGSILLDGAWKLPLREDKWEDLTALLVAHIEETFDNHGWEVPVLLSGGPLNGRHLTKHRVDLSGRLMFARKGRDPGEPTRAHLYKWRLKRSPKGEYVCVFERTLEGDEVDTFIARGVSSTGPFVLIHDK